MTLPTPDHDALAYSEVLARHIAGKIDAAGGWISFASFMELALYAPGKGYYAGGARKFGAAGDFVTAPELGPLFAQTLATQVAQVLAHSAPHIIEVGAGSGVLAADLLLELERRDALPASYRILDLSGELRARQQESIGKQAPHLLSRVDWLDRLPTHFDGLVLANELLDAMPIHLVNWRNDGIFERGVGVDANRFAWVDKPASASLLERARLLAEDYPLAPGYLSEIALLAPAWVAAWGEILGTGALLLIDYGFPQHEYYHAQRDSGTLMCHYRHHSHSEPFYLPGLQDITAHVDFTAITAAACESGLDFLGYTTQSTFLLNCGLAEVLARTPVDDPLRYLPLASEAQKLVSPSEMGELFKVIAFAKGMTEPLVGFVHGDRSATL